MMKKVIWLQRNVRSTQFAKTSQAMMSLLDLIVEQEELLKQLDKVINDREQHREQLLSCDSACSAECHAGIFDAAKEAKDTSSAAASEEAAPKAEGAAAAAASEAVEE